MDWSRGNLHLSTTLPSPAYCLESIIHSQLCTQGCEWVLTLWAALCVFLHFLVLRKNVQKAYHSVFHLSKREMNDHVIFSCDHGSPYPFMLTHSRPLLYIMQKWCRGHFPFSSPLRPTLILHSHGHFQYHISCRKCRRGSKRCHFNIDLCPYHLAFWRRGGGNEQASSPGEAMR